MFIKICGIKNKETLICCENNNVDFFGMIFYPKSPRYIKIENAKILQEFAINLKIEGVGVFVNEELERICNLIKILNLKYVQLHGNENETYVNSIKEFNVQVIKKISIKNHQDLNETKKFSNVDFFLFDYKPTADELPGGNAKKFDWEILKDLQIDKPWFLSGGVNIENIQLIKKEIKPLGVDLSSGVEKELGIKDNHIINNFIGKLNNA